MRLIGFIRGRDEPIRPCVAMPLTRNLWWTIGPRMDCGVRMSFPSARDQLGTHLTGEDQNDHEGRLGTHTGAALSNSRDRLPLS